MECRLDEQIEDRQIQQHSLYHAGILLPKQNHVTQMKNIKLTDPNDNLAPVADVSLVPKVGLGGNLP